MNPTQMPVGFELFLQLPCESQDRVLHAGTVLSISEGLIVAEFEESNLALDGGTQLLMYFEHNRKFMKQPATIEEAIVRVDDTAKPAFRIRPMGEPVSSEDRQNFRTSTEFSEVIVRVGNESDCKVFDVSPMGFSFISETRYQIGQILPVVVAFEGKRFSGNGCVQSIRELPAGEIRYGVYCADSRLDPANLMRGLQQISMAVQRQQLKRLSGLSGSGASASTSAAGS